MPFQFPPLREGRHGRNPRRYSRLISIHAPPRGATRAGGTLQSKSAISIHAPPRGATTREFWDTLHKLFQFTPLREGRRMLRIAASHACTAFQFPPLREGRLFSGVSKGAMSIFQFPPLREGRPVLPCSWRRGKHFNSRPSARGDGEKPPKGQISFTISIHAPPRGATVGIRHQQVAVGISIHAPPRGATCTTRRP